MVTDIAIKIRFEAPKNSAVPGQILGKKQQIIKLPISLMWILFTFCTTEKTNRPKTCPNHEAKFIALNSVKSATHTLIDSGMPTVFLDEGFPTGNTNNRLFLGNAYPVQ